MLRTLVVSNSDIIDSLKNHEYIKNKGYEYLPVGGAICGKEYDRIIIEFMDLTPKNLEWLGTIVVRTPPPILPCLPDFLREDINLNDHLLHVTIKSIRNKK